MGFRNFLHQGGVLGGNGSLKVDAGENERPKQALAVGSGTDRDRSWADEDHDHDHGRCIYYLGCINVGT